MLHWFKAAYHGLIDGYNGNNKHAHLYGIESEPDASILDEITTLEIIIDRQKSIGKILDDELTRTYDPKKRAVLLNKLNILDRQTLANMKKLNKLKGMV